MFLSRLRRLTGMSLSLVWRSARREFLWVASLDLVSGFAIAAQLLMLQRVVEGLSDAESIRLADVTPELIALGVLTVAVSAIGVINSGFREIIAELCQRAAIDQIIDVTTDVELVTFDDPEFHDHLSRAMAVAAHRPWTIVYGILGMMSSITAVGGLVVALIAIQPWLAALSLVGYVPLWLALRRNSRASYEFSHAIVTADRERSYLSRVLTRREHAAEVRVYDLPGFLRMRYDTLYDLRVGEMRSLSRARVRRSLAGAVGANLVMGFAVFAVAVLVVDDRIEVGAAAAAALATYQLGARLRSLNSGASSVYESALFLEDLAAFVDRAPLKAPFDPSVTPDPKPEPFTVSATDVTFTYPGAERPAVRNVSLQVEAGAVVALVGENGSGKTTLAKLLCGLYKPEHGRVEWDGVDPLDLDPAQRHARASAVFQDFVRYALPATENIGAGDHRRFLETRSIEVAAEQAGIADHLRSLPHGMDTRLSKEFADGTELSEGLWQRVAIARALFADTPLLVLDEPTASLDPRAEHDLFQRVRRLVEGRSVVLISHRLWTVRDADHICLLTDGEVTEQGTHDELLAAAGPYADLWSMQAEPYQDDLARP